MVQNTMYGKYLGKCESREHNRDGTYNIIQGVPVRFKSAGCTSILTLNVNIGL